jgi:hypothetical protein
MMMLCWCRYKQTLDLQVQQRQHEKWERLFIERVQYKKTVAVSCALLLHCLDSESACAPLYNYLVHSAYVLLVFAPPLHEVTL